MKQGYSDSISSFIYLVESITAVAAMVVSLEGNKNNAYIITYHDGVSHQ